VCLLEHGDRDLGTPLGRITTAAQKHVTIGLTESAYTHIHTHEHMKHAGSGACYSKQNGCARRCDAARACVPPPPLTHPSLAPHDQSIDCVERTKSLERS
jgi:hypothetical protein